MKKILIAVAAMVVAGAVMAQNHEQIHIYRNDKNFKTHKAKRGDCGQIRRQTLPTELKNMIVTTADGKDHVYLMSAVDSCVVRTTGIPDIFVNLIDYPEWTELQGAKDDVRAATLYMNGNGMYDDLEEQTVEFRGRGNSTWKMDKSPIGLRWPRRNRFVACPKQRHSLCWQIISTAL